MDRIPIIILGAGGSGTGGSGSGTAPTGSTSYELGWIEEYRQLTLSSDDGSDPQILTLTGLDGISSAELDKKQDKLTAGFSIGIEKDENTGETIISYTGTAGGITEAQARAIATEQANEAINNANLATKDEIPTKISDLDNDSGFVKTDDLSPVATSGNYSDLTGAPDPYDDTELRDAISEIDSKVDNLDEKLTSSDAITVSEFFGQLDPGKTYPPGTPIIDIIKDILDPAVPPTYVSPKLSISGTESGSEIAAGQTKNVTITLAFDRGSISTGGYRAGEAIEYSLNDGAYQASNVFNVTVSESNKTFKGKVRFGEGDQPKDSKGENYGEPLGAGEIESGTLTYKFASAVSLWSNAADITVVAKETGVNIASKTHTFQFVPQTEENPEIFDVPATWNVTSIECINDITGQWQSVAGDFDVSDTTHDGQSYKRYTDNREYDDDGRDIKITWS